MKNKVVDKKIIFLFLLMLVMVIFMIYLISQQEDNTEESLNMTSETKLELIKRKQEEIDHFLKNDKDLLKQGFQKIFDELNFISYIDLPLKIESDRNDYPFGNGLKSE